MSDTSPPMTRDPGVRSDRPPRPTAWKTVLQVWALTLRRGLRGKRLLAIIAITAFPALLSLLIASVGVDPGDQIEFFYSVQNTILLVVVVPCVALTLATAFPWPEAEEGTLTYWFTAPVWRWAVYLGRYLAGVTLGCAVLPLACLGLYLPLSPPEGAQLGEMTLQTIFVTWLAFPAYMAIFGLVSTVFRKGVIFGVVFIVLENSLASFQGNIQKLTVVYYERAFLWQAVPKPLRRLVDEWFLERPDSPFVERADALVMFATVPVLALALALVVIHLIEYRSKQGQSA